MNSATASALALPGLRPAMIPPEQRGAGREDVRLLVASASGVHHTGFKAIGEHLHAGDLLVVNTSATVNAAIDVTRDGGRHAVLHVAGRLDDGAWLVELRRVDGAGPELDGRPEELVHVSDACKLTLLRPRVAGTTRVWRASAGSEGSLEAALRAQGRPITYGHAQHRLPLRAYQTVFARHPGSAEMPSAARPFTEALVVELVTRGVTIAPVLLHAGLSSLEAGESPLPERFEVPAATARQVNATRRAGGRIIAAGTTVVRALESAVQGDRVVSAQGWTELTLTGEIPTRAVDGLLTGWHEPESTHLQLLHAVAGRQLVAEAYANAAEHDYLGHEFGDSCLLLPPR